ncbi:MAG: rhomboid family intramembrane serine protease [Candidatus Hydrogenedentota bacterium]|nr:MAG: rhomboid family intramembrane serine protease [Candidatus Hydrogenedentota bacterium]
MARYYGGSEFQFSVRITYAVKRLIIVNAAVFLLQQICRLTFGMDYLSLFLGLNSYRILHGMIWQPVTYMFLHYDLFHLLFNMFALWMFGSDIEGAWGPRAFLHYYFFTGIGAGLLSFLTSIGANVITIGASGAIFGILVAFGMLFPNRVVLVFFLFPMRARNFVILFGAIELWMTLASGPRAGGVARFAHLGGMLFGYLYLKYADRIRYSIPHIRITTGKRGKKSEQEWIHFMHEEVDPILDKISREGLHSLTRKERKILKKARGRRGNGG